MSRLVFLFALLLTVASQASDWSSNFDNTSGTFIDCEGPTSPDCSDSYRGRVSGTRSSLSTGFVRKTIDSASGVDTPSVGTTRYGLEAPDMFYLQEPTLTSETQLIYATSAGKCPTQTSQSIFVFAHWDPTGLNDMSQAAQPAFGLFTWNHVSGDATSSQGYGTVTGLFNATDFGSVGAPSFNVPAAGNATCTNGVIPIEGAGDRGGVLYMNAEGGGFFSTNGRKGIILLPQVKLPNGNSLHGNYASMRYENGVSESIQHMRVAISLMGTVAIGVPLADPADPNSATGELETFTVTALNAPYDGMVTGTLTRGVAQGKVACAAYIASRVVLFCAGQSPADNTRAVNLMMVSDPSAPFMRVRGFDKKISVMAWDESNSKLYVGGLINVYDGQRSNFLARVNSDGSLDTSFATGTGFNGEVTALQLDTVNHKLYVGGAFTTYNGAAAKYVARLNENGSLDTGFATTGTGFNARVAALQWDGANSKLYVGGWFITYNAISTKYVARLNNDGTLDGAFAPTGAGLNNRVYSMAWDAATSKLYIGGWFTTYNAVSKPYVARLTDTGAYDAGFAQTGTGLNNRVSSIQYDAAHGKLYVGGQFTAYNAVLANYVISLNSDGTRDVGFAPTGTGLNAQVQTVSYDSALDKIYVGGNFATYNGGASSNIARLNTDGTIDSTFAIGTGFSGNVFAIQPYSTGTGIFVGGVFQGYNGIGVNYFAQLANTGTLLAANAGSGFDGPVWVITPDATRKRVYVGGNFTNFNGTKRPRLARITMGGLLDNGFDIGTGFSNSVEAIQLDEVNNKVYVAGAFTTYNGVTVNRIVRLLANGALDTSFATGTGFSAKVWALQWDKVNNKLYAAGDFTTFNGASAKRIARLNSDGALDTTFATGNGLNVGVNTLLWDGDTNKLYVGGSFSQYNGTWQNRIARINSDGSFDSTFTHQGTETFDGLSGSVNNIMLDKANGKVYVCGLVSSYAYAAVFITLPGIARLEMNGSIDTTFATNAADFTGAGVMGCHLDVANSKIYIGQSATNTTPPVRRLHTTGALDPTFNPTFSDNSGATIDMVNHMAWDPVYGKLYIGGTIASYNGKPVDNFLRLNSSGELD